jgi:tetratricopeptide (TPR) repeat protein
MKGRFLTIALYIFCLSSLAYGQQAKLEGYVYDDKDVKVSSVKIIAPNGETKETDSQGHFFIAFPNSIKPGQATRIEVVKPNWVIYEPMLGNCVIQSTERNYEPLKVIIVPKGSSFALSPKRLGRVIAKWADERAKLRSQVDKLNDQLDEYVFLREYSEKYGFTLEQFVAAAQQWAVSKESDDKEEQALKEYFLKNYDRAAQLAHEAALVALARLKQDNRQKTEDSLKVIRLFKLEGDARYEKYKFQEALTAYNEIENCFLTKVLSKDDLINEWAEINFLLGNTKTELGIRTEDQESQLLLAEAAQAYQEALKVYMRQQLLQDWARTQNNLSIALRFQGERLADGEDIKLLQQGAKTIRDALTIFTREQSQQWAAAQCNLASILQTQGERLKGESGMALLQQAVEAYQEALKIFTCERWPQQWATAQTDLGIALKVQGQRLEGGDGIKLLQQGVKASRDALMIFTREQQPQQWAAAQCNLGAALKVQGDKVKGAEGIKLLQQAVEAFNEALKVYIREQLPHQWVVTQNNLAKTYFLLQNWPDTVESFLKILTFYPNHEEAYLLLSMIYHEVLFRFDDAFVLNQQWVARHPDDISAQADFAEKHFTTGRFAECEQRINALLTKPEIPVDTKVALRVIEIADLLALGQSNQVPTKMEALIAEVSKQPVEFKVEWFFNGTKYFIGQNEKLSPYRAWLGQLFAALANPNRDQILKGLNEAKTTFK